RRVVLRDEALPVRHPAAGVEPGDVDRFLQGDGDALQRAGLTARAGVVGPDRLLAGTGEVADHHRVERAVVTLDAADVELGQRGGGDGAGAQRGGQRGRGRE